MGGRGVRPGGRSRARAPHADARVRRTLAPREADAWSEAVVCLLWGATFRAFGQAHLRWKHGIEDEHRVEDYKRRFGLPWASCRDTRRLLSEAAIARREREVRHWPADRVVRELRRLARAGLPLARRDLPHSLRNAVSSRFGRWEAAMRAAGLDPEPHRLVHRWDREGLLRTIRALAVPGALLSARRVGRTHPALHRGAIRHLGDWSAALRAAGLDPEAHREPRRWNLEIAREWVRDRHASGSPLTTPHVPAGLLRCVALHAGSSWGGFLESLGIAYPGQRHRHDWTDAKVLAEIRARRRRGLPLNIEAVKADGQALTHQARNRFGSWDGALAAAGVDPQRARRRRDWSRADILAGIRARHDRGRPMDFRTAISEERRLVRAAQRAFPSSWSRALEAAGLDLALARPPSPFSREKAEAWVRSRAHKSLSFSFSAAPEPLVRGVREHLGMTWIAFVKSLGLRYRYADGRVGWSAEEVRLQIRERLRRRKTLDRRRVAEEGSLCTYAVKYFGSRRNALRRSGARALA